jgi:penicillin-binding protein 1A
MLRGVVKRGTGRRMREIGKPIAGKTGTTNDSFDTWFMGFTPDLVAGVYVGFDEHRTLGPRSYGSNTAGPIFKQFMTKALEGEPGIPFRTPEGIRMVRMDLSTGERAGPDAGKVILEAFKEGNSPGDDQVVIRGGQPADGDGEAGTRPEAGAAEGDGGGPAVTGASGLY